MQGLPWIFISGQTYRIGGDTGYVQGTYFKTSWPNRDIIALVAGTYHYLCYNDNTKIVYEGDITATANQTLFSLSTNPINPSVHNSPFIVIKFK